MISLLRSLSRFVLPVCLILGLVAPVSAAMVRVLTVEGAISPASPGYPLRGMDEGIGE